jgi:hypothetical protein
VTIVRREHLRHRWTHRQWSVLSTLRRCAAPVEPAQLVGMSPLTERQVYLALAVLVDAGAVQLQHGKVRIHG